MPVRTWGNANGNWRDFFGWQQGGVPSIFDDVTIETFAVAIDPGPDAEANSLALRNGAQLSTASNLNVASNFSIGSTAATSTFSITAGTTTVNTLTIGDLSSFGGVPSGIVNISGGTLNAANLTVGSTGEGILNIANGGTVTSGSTIIVGGGGANGFINIGGQSAPAQSGTLNANINLQTNGSALTFRSTDYATHNGVVSGSGSIRVDSPGAFAILTGNSSNSGTTTIGAGSGLQIGDGGTSGRLGSGAVINDGQLHFNLVATNYTIANAISGSGGIQLYGGIQAVLSGNNSYSGTTNIAVGSQLRVDSQLGSGNVLANGILHLNNSMTFAGNIVGVGNLESSNGTVVLTSNFNSYSGTTTVLNGTLQIGNGGTSGTLGSGAVITNGTLDFNRSDNETISHAISGSGGIAVSSGGTTSFTGANTYAGTTTINSGAILELLGSGSLGTGTVTTNGLLRFNRGTNDYYEVNNVINGTGNLSIRSGVVSLNQNNNYSGSTTIAAGASLYVGDGVGGTTGSLGTGAVNVDGLLRLERSGAAYTVGNVISGAGNVEIDDPAPAIFTGTNTYTGSTFIWSGSTLRIGDGGNIGTLGTGAVTNNGLLRFDRIDNETIANTISGSGNVIVNGGGVTAFTGSNSYTGTTAVFVGATLQIGNGGSTGTLGAGGVFVGGILRFDRNDNETIANGISGNGSVVISSAGTTTLTANNSYAGTTTVNSGAALQVGNGGTAGSLGTGAVSNSWSLTFNRSGADYTVSNAITGIGSLTVTGGARATFSGALSFGAYADVAGGSTLALSGTASLANASSVSIQSGSTFDISGISTPSTSIRDILVSAGGQVVLGGRTLNVTEAFSFAGSGTFVGSGGTDALVFNSVTVNFSLAFGTTLFTGWTDGVDTITINGNGNDNILTGARANATIINGGGGFDTLIGGTGNDTLNGDGDNDFISGGLGADAINGGLGFDTANYSGSLAAVTINLGVTFQIGGEAQGDQLTSIERIVGSSFADSLTGSTTNDTLEGGGGADQLYGGEGNDTIFVDFLDTVIDGGNGTDTAVFSSTGIFTTGFTGIERLELNSGHLTISSSLIGAGFAANMQLLGFGSLTVNMGAGDSELYLQTLVGVSTVTVVANAGNNDVVIKGVQLSPNTINGGDGFDLIRGGRLADILNGGNGDDKIEGGQGADVLTGGAGADTFRYQSNLASGLGAGADRITDFVIGTDTLGFALIDADALTPGDQAFSFLGTGGFSITGVGQIRYQNSGGDLLVQVDSDGNGAADMEIILQGLAGQTLTPGDFNL